MVSTWDCGCAQRLRIILFGITCFVSAGSPVCAARTNYANASSVTVVFGDETENVGLREAFPPDGGSVPGVIRGQKCHLVDLGDRSVRYLYLAIDPTFKWKGHPETNRISVRVEVEYFDNMPGSFDLQFEGTDPLSGEHATYCTAPGAVRHTGVLAWRAARFDLRDARFLNGQNGRRRFSFAHLHEEILHPASDGDPPMTEHRRS